jgi:hypothetical protein
MDFLERDLEEIIFNANLSDLAKRGLSMELQRKRQFKIGNYGIADIVGFERPFYSTHCKKHFKGIVTIYEFKKDAINISAFLQAIRYLKGVKQFLKKRNLEESYNYKIVLIGRSLDLSSSFSYLPDLISNDIYDMTIHEISRFNLEFYTYSYGLDGLNFTQEYGYKLINEGF